MRHFILLFVLGPILAIPATASACHRHSCSGCHGGRSSCHGSGCHGYSRGCHGSYHGSYAYGCTGANSYVSMNGYSNGYAYYPSVNTPNGYIYQDQPNGGTSYRTSAYYDADGQMISTSDKQALVDVILPDANTELYIQDQKMTTVGTIRTFYSPDLDSGKSFTYTLKIRRNGSQGQIKDETRNVQVKAGSRTVVDFTKPNGDSLPIPSNNIENKPRPTEPIKPQVNPPKGDSTPYQPK